MKIIIGDLTQISADTIINPANTKLDHAGGVACALVRKGGNSIQAESDKIGYCAIGEAVYTSAANLKAKYLIHVPTINYEKNIKANFNDIRKGFTNALKLAQKLKLKSVATPLLGTGVVGLGKKEVEKILSEVSLQFPGLEVILVKRS